MSSPYQKNKRFKPLGQNDGQIVLEYILILVIAVATAIFLTRALVGRGDSQGIVIQAWGRLNQMIGADIGD
jgi:hypothetical protein